MAMFALTKKADYALIALCHLSSEANRLSSARSIATKYGMPLPILTNVMKALAAAGLVNSERGARGGYSLAKTPEEITLRDLVAAIDGPPTLSRCSAHPGADPNGQCGLESKCPIRSPVRELQVRLMDFLDGVTLAQLADRKFGAFGANLPPDLAFSQAGAFQEEDVE